MNILILFGLLATILNSIVLYNFIFYFIKNRIKTNQTIWYTIQLIAIGASLSFYFGSNSPSSNDIDYICCGGMGSLFSIENLIGIYTLIILYKLVFIFTVFYTKILPPLFELIINVFLVIGVIFNLLLLYHTPTEELNFMVHIYIICPVILLLILKLIQRQNLLYVYILENKITSNTLWAKYSIRILSFKPIKQFPILLILSIPILLILTSILVVIGQKPDTLVRAFTETYKNGFSQLSYDCSNIQCGGHFLCSVGALGHKSIVKPIRYGERKGKKIICTRQLLVSNAFEELIQEKLPLFHKYLRKNYNKVGNMIHQYYDIFNIKIVSDVVYLMMKPLEWFFLIILYLFDYKPENRISKQYLNTIHKKEILKLENSSQHGV